MVGAAEWLESGLTANGDRLGSGRLVGGARASGGGSMSVLVRKCDQ